MSYKLNIFTGQLDEVGSGSGGGGGGGVTSVNGITGAITIVGGDGVTITPSGSTLTIDANGNNFNVDYFTLTLTDISNKSVTLNNTPLVSADVLLNVVGGILQQYSVDYTVSGNTLLWNGLGLDPILSSGDILIINYFS